MVAIWPNATWEDCRSCCGVRPCPGSPASGPSWSALSPQTGHRKPASPTHENISHMRCCGPVTFWYISGSRSGSGSGSCYFRQWPSRWQLKINNFNKFFCLLLFEATLISFFKDKVIKRSKTVPIKVFLTIFAWWQKDPELDPYLKLMDPQHCLHVAQILRMLGSRYYSTNLGFKLFNCRGRPGSIRIVS